MNVAALFQDVDASALLAEKKLAEFVRLAWPSLEAVPYCHNWHIDCICDHLQAVSSGQIKNLMMNVPPGCCKSYTTSVFWFCWEWLKQPSLRWITASYDAKLSMRDAVRCRKLINSVWYQERWGDRFSFYNDQNQKSHFENDHGGYRFATSVGGHVTGEHPDRVVIDDPISAKSARRKAARNTCIEWWSETLSTRGVSRGVSKVVIMQRLHVEDLAGYIEENELADWEFVCLPMRFEKGRMRKTSIGWWDLRETGKYSDLLWPQLFPEEKVKKLELTLGDYGIAGQLQQRPVPDGGGIIRAESIENNIVARAPDSRIAVARAWDLAGTGGGGDETAGAKVSYGTDGFYYVEHVDAGQWGTTERDNRIQEVAELDGPGVTIGVPKDPAAGGLSQVVYLIQRLRKFRVKPMPTNRSKEARLDRFATLCGMNMVRFVDGPWLRRLKDQLTQFPSGSKDDMCDAVGDAITILLESLDSKIKLDWFGSWFTRASGLYMATEAGDVQLNGMDQMRTFVTVVPNSLDATPSAGDNRYSSLVIWSYDTKHQKALVRFAWFGLAAYDELLRGIAGAAEKFGAKQVVVSAGDSGIGLCEKIRTIRLKESRLNATLVEPIVCSEAYLKFAEFCVSGKVLLPKTTADDGYIEFSQHVTSWSGSDKDFVGYIACGIMAESFIRTELGEWGGVVGGSGPRIASVMNGSLMHVLGST